VIGGFKIRGWMLKTLRLLWSRPPNCDAHKLPPWRQIRFPGRHAIVRSAAVTRRYFKGSEISSAHRSGIGRDRSTRSRAASIIVQNNPQKNPHDGRLNARMRTAATPHAPALSPTVVSISVSEKSCLRSRWVVTDLSASGGVWCELPEFLR
jgi:hypothetical protein